MDEHSANQLLLKDLKFYFIQIFIMMRFLSILPQKKSNNNEFQKLNKPKAMNK